MSSVDGDLPAEEIAGRRPSDEQLRHTKNEEIGQNAR